MIIGWCDRRRRRADQSWQWVTGQMGHVGHLGGSRDPLTHFTFYSSGIPRDFLIHGKPATAIETVILTISVTAWPETCRHLRKRTGKAQVLLTFQGRKINWCELNLLCTCVSTVWSRNRIDTSFPLPRVRKRHTVTVTGEYFRESWVMSHAGHGSIGWWVTWVMGHKMWPIVSSGADKKGKR